MKEKTFGETSFTFKGIVWSKVLAGAGVTVAGALLTFFTAFFAGIDWSQVHLVVLGMDLSSLVPLTVMAVWTTISNIVRKWTSSIE